MSELEQLFTKYGTDKGIWGYTPAYEKHLEPLRVRANAVLEIGVCGYRDIPNNVVGASLFAWRDYFATAKVFGIENDSKFMVNGEDYIRTAVADAYDVASLAKALTAFGVPQYDFICDDCVHDPLNQLFLLKMLWPFVRVGGVYAIEEFCPYKVPSEELFAHLVMASAPGARIDIYSTHKDERLAILTRE